MPGNQLIVFLSPDTIDPEDFRAFEKPVRWVYLGKKFQEKARLETELGESFLCLDIARTLNEVSELLRIEFVQWIEFLNARNGSSPEWWFGSISSRNIYRSSLFEFCCYIGLLDRLWREDWSKPVFVVVESAGFVESLRNWGNVHHVNVVCQNRIRECLRPLRILINFFLRWIYFIGSLELRRMLFRVIVRDSGKCIPGGVSPVIIHTYIHPESINECGEFNDRYFPYLYDFLKNKERKIAVIPTYQGFRHNYSVLFRKIRKSDTCFLSPEKFLKFSDYIYSYCIPFFLLIRKYRAIPFQDIDHEKLLREDTLNDKFEDLLDAILLYRLIPRLKQTPVLPERLIDWYENQAINRALARGFHENYPEARVLGVQLFLHSSNFLSFSPTPSEISVHVVPEQLLETSNLECTMAKRFAPDLACKPCAALRYVHVFEEKNLPEPCGSGYADAGTILLLTSFNFDETIEVIFQLRSVPSLSDIQEAGRARLLIKLHPDLNSDEIIGHSLLSPWPSNFTLFKGNLAEALAQASLVISKGSSSMVEAAAGGIPVIFLGNQTTLNTNPLENISSPLVRECYSVPELEDAIHSLLSCASADKQELGKQGTLLRDLFFTRITEESLAPFLE